MFLSEIQKLEKKYLAQTYRRFDGGIAAGSGSTASGFGGESYLDFSSGIGVNALGFADASWVDAVKAQLDQLAHVSNLYYTAPMVRLAKELCERTGMERVFFANSGAEANEGAIKTARKYGAAKRGPACHEIVSLTGSFHGRTIATLAATGQDAMHKDFGPFPPGFVYAQAGDLSDLAAKAGKNTCAVMIECIQGEGGVNALEAEFLAGAAALCAEREILLLVDEVQSGVGRTGKFLCCDHFGLKPDIVTLAKGLGGGLPIGAVLFGEKTKDTLSFGDHGSTFGGNPVVCAGALAVLTRVDGKFLDSVTDKGAYLAQRLAAIPEITGVSGKGLMLGASLVAPLAAPDIVAACLKAGLIVLTAKEKLRFLPPLTITKKELDDGLAILSAVLREQKEEADAAPAENE